VTSVRNPGADPKRAVGAFCVKAAAEQGRAFAHADQSVTPAAPRRAVGQHRVRNGELDRLVGKRKLDPGAARSMVGGVRERLLENPVGGLVGGASAILGFLGIQAASLAAPWWTYLAVAAAGLALPLLMALIPLVKQAAPPYGRLSTTMALARRLARRLASWPG